MSQKFEVILVDDEVGILELYESFIPTESYLLVKFSEPEEAFKHILQHHQSIAFIISDYKMPTMNGFELRQKMLDHDLVIPFAMITGYFDREMAAQGMKLKISEFIEKPIDEEKVLSLLEREATKRISTLLEDREMVSEFLQETRPMLEEIEELILSLEDDPHDTRAVNTYFRLLHTIKGTSSCLGLTEISGYAHKYEDLITAIQNSQISVTKKVTDVLLIGLDQLKELYDLAENFDPLPTDLDEKATIFSQDFSSSYEIEKMPDSVDTVPEKKARSKEKEDKVNVPEKLLAEFLEMSGELTVIRNAIFKSLLRVQDKLPGDRDVDHLGESLQEMQKVSAILQNQIAEMKKVSIETVYRPMKRVVRDSCAVLGKKVDFEIQGEDLKIDTSAAKLLNGVLVHLLRNGVDHGIETKEERVELGKPENGKLILNSYQTGEDIIVEIIDDGKGLDKEMLKRKALEKELYTEEELSQMNDQKIFSIIFESGFSTNTEVTSVSGRGVGMDMVKSSIEEFGGKILIDSKIGKGSKFILVVPIPRSILIIKSLIVMASDHKFNIPLDDVDEVVLYDAQKDDQKVYCSNGGLILKHHDNLCPLVDLGNTLELNQRHLDSINFQNIVIVKGDGYRFGLMVDLIKDIEEIVVKKLSGHFNVKEYLGTTFADDGELSMILDCKGIAEGYNIESELEDEEENFLDLSDDENVIQEFMRFSLRNAPNCALPLNSVYRLEEVEAKEIQFSGERALIRYRGQSLQLLHVESLLNFSNEVLQDLVESDQILSVLVVKYEDKLYGAIIDELHDIAVTRDKIEEAFSDRIGLKGTVTIDNEIVSVVDMGSLINGRVSGTLSFNNLDKAA